VSLYLIRVGIPLVPIFPGQFRFYGAVPHCTTNFGSGSYFLRFFGVMKICFYNNVCEYYQIFLVCLRLIAKLDLGQSFLKSYQKKNKK